MLNSVQLFIYLSYLLKLSVNCRLQAQSFYSSGGSGRAETEEKGEWIKSRS